MRLLLDEMYPAGLARQLGRRGHDVTAVAEQPEMRSLADADLFRMAQTDRRAVATENIADFVRLVEESDRRGTAHFGLILVDPIKYPRGQRRTIGRLVTQLDRWLGEHPEEQPGSLRHWL